MRFTKEHAEKGRLATKIRSKAFKMLKEGKEVDIDELRNSEEAKRLAELGVDVDAKIAEMVEKAKAMIERNKSKRAKNEVKEEAEEVSNETNVSDNVGQGIDPDLIKQAVNECIQGQCELLDKLVLRVESFQNIIDSIKNEIADIKNIKPEVDTSSIEGRIAKIESEIEQLKSLPDGVAQKVKESVNPEIEGIAKETINALMEIKAGASSQQQKEEIVPISEALKNEKYRDAVLKEIEKTVQEDPKALESLRDLVMRCQAGDQNACDVLTGNAQPQSSDIEKKISEIFKKLNEIDNEIKNKAKEEEKEVVKEQKPKSSNPLRNLLFG